MATTFSKIGITQQFLSSSCCSGLSSLSLNYSPMNLMPADPRLKAAVAALRLWGIIWIVVVHIFVVWKWESYAVSPRSEAAVLVLEQQQQQTKNQTTSLEHPPVATVQHQVRTVIVDQTVEWQTIIEATQNQLASTTADIQRLQAKQAQVQETLARMNRTLDNLSVKEKQLERLQKELENGEKPPMAVNGPVFADGSVPPDELLSRHLTHILSMHDLGKITDKKDLERAFASILQAMRDMETNDTTQWVSVNDILRQSFPAKRSTISACPAIPQDDEETETFATNTSTTLKDSKKDKDEAESTVPLVTVQDVENRQDEIRALWDTMYEEGRPLPVSDKEIKRLEKIRQDLVDEWMQRVQASLNEALDKVELAISAAQASYAESEDDLVSQVVETDEEEDEKTAKCAKTNDVLAVLEAGIEAVHRNMDLQEALRKAMSERDRELKNVILDADLPLDEERPAKVGPETLRQYLDTALLAHDVPKWIHDLVDMVGGHNDYIDKFIDTLPENVGEVAVQKILDAAGQVNLSRIQGYVERHVSQLVS